MYTDHPSTAELVRFSRGSLDGPRLAAFLGHMAACAGCNATLGRILVRGRGSEATPAVEPDGYDGVFRRAASRGRALRSRVDRETREAHRLLPRALRLPSEAREALIRDEPRFQTYAFARSLLDQVTRAVVDEPRAAEELARLALQVAAHLPLRSYGKAVLADLQAEAWGHVGNARRVRSDFGGAAEALERADHLRLDGSRDPMEEAFLATLRASYLRALDRRSEARDLLDHAISIQAALGDRHLEGRALASRALLAHETGDLDEAIHLLDRAAGLVDPSREPRLPRSIRKNRALMLGLSDRRETVDRAIDALRREPDPGPLDRLRSLWSQALLLWRLERFALAEEALGAARRGFARAGIPFDTALLDLDLARLHLQTGRTEEARERTLAAFPVFTARRLEKQTLQALELFRATGAAG